MELQLENAGKRFNYEWIFRRLTFNFLPGNQYAILGPNGSGKSTFLQCLSGARMLNEGSFRFVLQPHNSSISNTVDPEFQYRHIAFAAPYLELIEELTLLELIRFHQNVKPFRHKITPEFAAEIAQLTKALHKPIKLYSSGMKQRVKLLLAVLSDVSVVLLDEPATNLDIQGIEWYKRLIAQYCSRKTLIIASNDIQEYDFCEHRINILDYKR